jgi:hypothetical protein
MGLLDVLVVEPQYYENACPPMFSHAIWGRYYRGHSEYQWCREPHGIKKKKNNLLIIILGYKVMCFFVLSRLQPTKKQTSPLVGQSLVMVECHPMKVVCNSVVEVFHVVWIIINNIYLKTLY